MSNNQIIAKGSKFKGSSFHRATSMSVALAAAGVIPDVHLVRDNCATARVRSRNDYGNERNSIQLHF